MSCKCTPPVTRTHKQTAGVNETNTDRETSPNAHQSKRGSKALPSCMKERMFNFNHQGKKTLTNCYDLVLFTFRFSWIQKSVTSVSSIPGSTTQWRVRRDQCHSHTTVVKPCPHSSEQLPTEAQQNYLTRQQRQIGQGAEAKTIALMLSLDNQLVGKLPTLNSTRERLKEH